MGELSDVYPNDEILEFISGGAKVYTIKLKNKKGEIWHEQKLKGNSYFSTHLFKFIGVTLDAGNSKIFNHEELKRRVLRKINGEEDAPMQLNTRNFRISIDGDIHTVHAKKKFEINLNKGVLISHGQIVPFGYSGDLFDPRNDDYYFHSHQDRITLAETLANRYHPSNPLNYLLHFKSFSGFHLRDIFHYPNDPTPFPSPK